MRLYFQLVASGDAIQDLEGFEATDPGQAQAEALRLLAEMRQEDPSATQDWSGWTLRVTEGSGRVVSLSTSTAVFTERCGGSGSIARMPICQRGHRRP
jgi:hypothetical protein